MIDALVLGTGRSGTSNTCRVLNEYFDVCFGHDLVGTPNKHGETIWEDASAKKWLREVLGGARSVDWLHQKILSQHKPYGCARVGLKLLDTCLLKNADIASFEPDLIVRTFRPRESYITSWLKPGWRGTRQHAEFNYDRREARLVEIEHTFDVVKLFFDPEQRHLPDEDILEAIGSW